MHHHKSIRGFSYLELIISVSILALLATAATPYLEKKVARKKEAELRRNLREIRTALDRYKQAHDTGKIDKTLGGSGYPANLEILVDGMRNKQSPSGEKIRFLRRIPADPMYQNIYDEEVTASATWGKRAYVSEADNPQEGADVYDVYSLSEQKGLNGVPYNQW